MGERGRECCVCALSLSPGGGARALCGRGGGVSVFACVCCCCCGCAVFFFDARARSPAHLSFHHFGRERRERARSGVVASPVPPDPFFPCLSLRRSAHTPTRDARRPPLRGVAAEAGPALPGAAPPGAPAAERGTHGRGKEQFRRVPRRRAGVRPRGTRECPRARVLSPPRPHARPLCLPSPFSQVDLDSLSVQLAAGSAELRGVLLDAGAVDALVVRSFLFLCASGG